MKQFSLERKGQIFVEAVIYTLIGLVIMATLLAFVRPKIQDIQDRATIEQSIEILEYVDQTIFQINRGGPGNTRNVELTLKKGEIVFDGISDSIYFLLQESKSEYSQLDTEIQNGPITILTMKSGEDYSVYLTLNYSSEYDLKFESEDKEGSLSKSPSKRKILLSNLGSSDSIINIEVVQ